jgi:hypothetical protein
MGRLEKYNFDLSDGEKRDLITLIQQGKPLPEKYRFLLFEDKREVELVWNGKRARARSSANRASSTRSRRARPASSRRSG